MRQLATDGSKDLSVRDESIRVLQRASVPAGDYLGEIEALFAFVRDMVRDTRDIWGVETLQTPAATLARLAGDCDDKATLLAAMLLSVGQPVDLSFQVVGLDPARPGQFSHVYVVALLAGQRIPLDPTFGSTFGWEVPAPTVAGVFAL